MKITPFQRKNLKALLLQKDSGVTVWRMLVASRSMLIVHAIICVGAAFYLTQNGVWQIIGSGLAGFALGSYLRFVRGVISISQFWPVTTEIIDWKKAESVLRENETSGRQGQF